MGGTGGTGVAAVGFSSPDRFMTPALGWTLIVHDCIANKLQVILYNITDYIIIIKIITKENVQSTENVFQYKLYASAQYTFGSGYGPAR